MTLKFNNKKAEQKILDQIETDYEQIKVHPGKMRWNYQCHRNSVHEAIKNGDKKIAVVMYVDNDGAIVHFVNYRNGKFIDNTLGLWATQYDYYFIRWVKKNEFYSISKILGQYQDKFRHDLGWWLRLTSNTRF